MTICVSFRTEMFEAHAQYEYIEYISMYILNTRVSRYHNTNVTQDQKIRYYTKINNKYIV